MSEKGISSDVRFGATFLDVRYKDKAVKGEVMSDKTDAELYLKRPSDGRVVAYNEKVISIYEFINELNIQFQSALGYKYPSQPSSLFVSSRFDANSIADNAAGDYEIDVLTKNLMFPERVETSGNFIFQVSKQTNGFIMKPYMRHVDRNLLGLLAATFTEYEESGKTGATSLTFGKWLAASPLYGVDSYNNWSALDYWKESTAMISYEVIVIGTTATGVPNTTRTANGQACIRLNEMSYVQFPSAYMFNMKTADKINVRINAIKFPKLQYAAAILGLPGSKSQYQGFMENDSKICMRSVDLNYFIDTINQRIDENKITTTHFCTDYLFLKEAMDRTQSTGGGKAVVSQVNQPNDDEWSLNTMWSEETRTIKSGNKVTPTGSANTFESLEKYIYIDREIETEFTTNKSDKTGLYVERQTKKV